MKSLWRTSLVGLALLLVLGVTTGHSAAHVLKQDHGIAGVLHIAPEDNPSAGEPTVLDVSFGDPKNAFNLADCDCRVMVKNNGRTLQTVALKPYASGATLDSTATVQFPAVGVYDVIVQGRARQHGFPDFQLDYLVRVATIAGGAPSSSRDGSDVVIIGLGALAVLGLFAYTNIRAGGRYASSAALRSGVSRKKSAATKAKRAKGTASKNIS